MFGHNYVPRIQNLEVARFERFWYIKSDFFQKWHACLSDPPLILFRHPLYDPHGDLFQVTRYFAHFATRGLWRGGQKSNFSDFGASVFWRNDQIPEILFDRQKGSIRGKILKPPNLWDPVVANCKFHLKF